MIDKLFGRVGERKDNIDSFSYSWHFSFLLTDLIGRGNWSLALFLPFFPCILEKRKKEKYLENSK